MEDPADVGAIGLILEPLVQTWRVLEVAVVPEVTVASPSPAACPGEGDVNGGNLIFFQIWQR